MSFTFNSVPFANYGVEVTNDFQLTGAASYPIASIGLPAAPKVWYYQAPTERVEITFPVRIKSTTPALLFAALDSINAALKTTADAVLTFGYTDRSWMARWDGQPLRLGTLNSAAFHTTIRFYAQPTMVATTPVSASKSLTASPQTVYVPGPNSNSGVVSGNAETWPVLIVKNTGAEIASGALQITNAVTGDSIVYGDTIPTNRYVKFDCATRICSVSTDGTTYTAVTGKVLTSWLTFTGGAAANLLVVGCAAGTLYWTYTARYA